MSPKHKMITTIWCLITMIATMLVSHGHLVMKEIITHWPTEDTWEGRIENALYTQGGLVFIASTLVGGAILIRGFFVKAQDDKTARRNHVQREQHERAAAQRHDALMESLANLTGTPPSKKPQASGARPR
jgi:hypothetical protein